MRWRRRQFSGRNSVSIAFSNSCLLHNYHFCRLFCRIRRAASPAEAGTSFVHYLCLLHTRLHAIRTCRRPLAPARSLFGLLPTRLVPEIEAALARKHSRSAAHSIFRFFMLRFPLQKFSSPSQHRDEWEEEEAEALGGEGGGREIEAETAHQTQPIHNSHSRHGRIRRKLSRGG